MSKVDIVSGFLGAGKTTLIKKLLSEAFHNEQVVLIENEFGEIGIDSGFLNEAGIEIKEMNQGCICCSLVGDFSEALKNVLTEYKPDRVIIEPSGVGKLSDVMNAIKNVEKEVEAIELNSFVTIVDVEKCKMYSKNFGEFYNDQISSANCVILSRSQKISKEKLEEVVAMIREINQDARIVTTPWEEIDGKTLLNAMEQTKSLEEVLIEEEELCPHCGHHHHHHHHDHEEAEECGCGHHHSHHHHDLEEAEECGCGHHHSHHHHDHEEAEECGCGHHHSHHHHDHEEAEECGCGHHPHHHHHAEEIFTSWGVETSKVFTKQNLQDILESLSNTQVYGFILRAKGMLEIEDGKWIHFDLVPENFEIREGTADYTGRICVIGTNMNKTKVAELFTIE